ncbi:NADP(H)-dependent aldo-keto reductase [Zhouia sp. PK063]|uniref:NADP(H)-dependent aldo-keto reductase n=1 Tax=Zhouia sp. PK063 TaxID=3373602 RepID=UPI0037A0E27F
MKYTTLPNTDIKVSKICLGTMTWGEQNTQADGHEQMDYALSQGVNFFDTAELYPVPARPETYATTEKIIGTWFKKTGNRDKIILASKIAGPEYSGKHIRNNEGFTKDGIVKAIDASLERLQTDYIDVYQLHWPERNTNFFGQRGYAHDTNEKWNDNIKEILEVLGSQIKAGKIRHIGLSNETPFGVTRYIEESEKHDLPRMITIQNPYSLLNRLFEVGNAEIALRKNIGLLPYSTLGFGRLTGKYRNGNQPVGARLTIFPNFSRYNSENSVKVTDMYYNLAKEHNLSLATMALAFVNQQPFVTSNIVGATKMEQLKENISSIDVTLSSNLIEKINEIHNQIPNPAP